MFNTGGGRLRSSREDVPPLVLMQRDTLRPTARVASVGRVAVHPVGVGYPFSALVASDRATEDIELLQHLVTRMTIEKEKMTVEALERSRASNDFEHSQADTLREQAVVIQNLIRDANTNFEYTRTIFEENTRLEERIRYLEERLQSHTEADDVSKTDGRDW